MPRMYRHPTHQEENVCTQKSPEHEKRKEAEKQTISQEGSFHM